MDTKGYPTVTQKTPRIWPSVITAIVLLIGLAAPALAQNYTIAPPPFQTELDNSGVIVVGGCVWTYAAGTTTPIATYSNNSGTPNTNPIVADTSGRFTAYLLAGTNYKFVYETACTSPAHGSVLRTADNIAGVPASAATVDVSGVAGETISAGQAVYLSDGSGSKVPGSWYKADSTNSYSSVAAVAVGLAPSAIVSGATGTIRLAGSVTGLTALTPGTRYYVGVSGALTATAPTNARVLGIADTATSIVETANPGIPVADNSIDDFRLTLTTGVPITPSDVTAATTLYASPLTGTRIALADSTGATTVLTCVEFSIAIPATTSQMYDVWAFNNAGVCALELLAWTNDTTRATAVARTTTGFLTKTGDLTRRYLGSMRTTTVSGQTEDSGASCTTAPKRYVWNAYNRVRRPVCRLDTTDSWNYTSTTVRQANAAAANQVDLVIGLQETTLDLTLIGISSGATGNISVGIGEDVTNAYTTGAQQYSLRTGDGNFITQYAHLLKMPALGRHFYSWNESGNATNVFYGDNGGSVQAGLIGWWEN